MQNDGMLDYETTKASDLPNESEAGPPEFFSTKNMDADGTSSDASSIAGGFADRFLLVGGERGLLGWRKLRRYPMMMV
jgi:hypothetical protein